MQKKYLYDDEWRAKKVWTKLDKIQQAQNIIYQPKNVPASINMKQSKIYAFKHNGREADSKKLEAKYTFKEFESLNEYSCTQNEAQEKYDELLKEATQNYYERTGQQIQDKTNGKKFRWGCVVNINAEHTLEDIERVADKLCEKYGWQKLQVAIHRDEGHYKRDANGDPELDENGKKTFIPNLHAHIEFFMLDKQGIYRYKKRDFGKKTMSEMQTFIAKELGMERGEKYYENLKNLKKWQEEYEQKLKDLKALTPQTAQYQAKLDEIQQHIEIQPKPKPKPKRLEHRELRQEMAKREILEAKNRATLKELNQKNIKLRELLQEYGATREDYAKLEQKINEWREKIRNKELMSKDELEKQIALIQEQIEAKFKAEKEKSDKEKNEQIQNLLTQNENLKAEKEQLNAQISMLNEKITKDTTQSDKTQENANPSLEQLFLKQIDEKGLKRPEYLQFYEYNNRDIDTKDCKEKNDLDKAKKKFADDEKMQEFLKKYKPIQSTEKLVISYYKRKGINEIDIPLYPLQMALNRVKETNKEKGLDYER